MPQHPERRRRIVFVVNRLAGGGAQRIVITLGNALARAGHDVHLVCFVDQVELQGSEALTIHRFRRGFAWLPDGLRSRLLARRFDAFVRERIGTPDLVLSNLSKANRILAHSRLDDVQIIVHNTLSKLLPERGPLGLRRALVLQRLRAVYGRKPCICCSDGVLEDLRTLLPRQDRLQRIYNPLNVDETRSWARAGSAPDGDYVVHVGAFIEQKRHDVLLRAFAQAGVDARLVLCGKGRLEAATRELATELGIADRVVFAGFQSNPFPTIAGARLMVLSSDHEGLPLVVLEALGLGVPVVSTDCPSGPREILPADQLCPVGDVEALAQLIRRAWERPQTLQRELPAPFHLDEIARQYLALCRD